MVDQPGILKCAWDNSFGFDPAISVEIRVAVARYPGFGVCCLFTRSLAKAPSLRAAKRVLSPFPRALVRVVI